MMKTKVLMLFEALNTRDSFKLNQLFDDHCLYINYDQKATLTKEKVINQLLSLCSKTKQITLINSVQDSSDTLLIAFNILLTDDSTSFGSAVIRFKADYINYLKVLLLK